MKSKHRPVPALSPETQALFSGLNRDGGFSLEALKRAAQERDRAELASGKKSQRSLFLLTEEDLQDAVVRHPYDGF